MRITFIFLLLFGPCTFTSTSVASENLWNCGSHIASFYQQSYPRELKNTEKISIDLNGGQLIVAEKNKNQTVIHSIS